MNSIVDISSKWRQFGSSLAYSIVLPLVPLVIEFVYDGKITAQSLTLATAIYAATIGLSSKNAVLLSITLFVSIIFAVAFGRIMGAGSVPDGCSAAALLSLTAITVVHVCERYIKHVGKGELFIEMPESK